MPPPRASFWCASARAGQAHHYPRTICPFCFSDKTEWIEASGKGTIYSYSVMRRAPVPYAMAFAGLGLAHAIYWAITHPVNKVWVKDEKLSKSGGAFFAAGNTTATGDWTELRDRWEWSHVARAALAVASLIALVIAVIRPA